MRKRFGAMLAMAVLLLGDVALAKPTPEEITEARADCRRNRERVEQLEGEFQTTDTARDLAFARTKWEDSCVYAESLMIEAGIEKPSPPPRAPLPPQEIRIIERRPAPLREAPPQVGGTPRRDAASPSPEAQP
jgi:hypothetical protein